MFVIIAYFPMTLVAKSLYNVTKILIK